MLQQEDLLTQKIELILEMNGKKVLSEISKLREDISALKLEVEGLKKAQRFGSGAPEPHQAPQQQWQQPQQQAQWQQAPQQCQPAYPQQPEPQRPQNKPIDRNGVAPSEVSIEKMFYFGNKK